MHDDTIEICPCCNGVGRVPPKAADEFRKRYDDYAVHKDQAEDLWSTICTLAVSMTKKRTTEDMLRRGISSIYRKGGSVLGPIIRPDGPRFPRMN
jgi:hypothetical protein